MTPVPSFADLRYASLTDVGVKRSHNQDACTTQPATDAEHYRMHGHIFVVADGMGGHAVGEKASAKAVRDIPLTYVKHVVQEGPAAAIRRAFKEANEAIYQIGQNNPEFKGLGTTATALFLLPEGAWIGHVGDSRAYRVRHGRVQQLTFDHSWVWEVARRQGIDPDELGDFKRNVIIRSLGPDADVEVDIEGPHPVEPGDQFLLCSDGLSNMVTPEEIGAVLATFEPEQACQFLVELANARGGPDNITCVIAQIPGSTLTTPRDSPKKSPLHRLFEPVIQGIRQVPWPLLSLGAAVLLAGLSVALHLLELPGKILFFLLAAAAILAGLVGLVLQARSRRKHDTDYEENDGELRLYRDYQFAVDEQTVARLQAFEEKLRQEIDGQPLTIDWETHRQFQQKAEAFRRNADWPSAFRWQCLALQCLAVPFNKARHKDEAFKPNWTQKPSN